MANKIQIRRGTAAQLATVTLDAGELGWTTDTKRIYGGDGATAGGKGALMLDDSTTFGLSLLGAANAAAALTALGFVAPILDRASPGAIGATTPGTIAATTISASDAITTANSVVITASVPFLQLNDSDSSARDFRCVVNSDKLFFQTDATADSGAFDRNVMTIDGAANAVAIGATTLVGSEKLRVAGAINTSGVLTVTDATEATSVAGSILTSGGISAARGILSQTWLDAPRLRYGGTDILARANTWTASQEIHSATGLSLTAIASSRLRALTNGDSSRVELSSWGGSGALLMCRAFGGTFAAPAATSSGQFIFVIDAYGHDGASYITSAAGGYRVSANGTWSSTNRGVVHAWSGTPSGSTTTAEWMRLINGGLAIGSTALVSGEKLRVAGDMNISGKITGPTALPASFADLAAVRTFLATLIA